MGIFDFFLSGRNVEIFQHEYQGWLLIKLNIMLVVWKL
jgi:hypothetical protein